MSEPVVKTNLPGLPCTRGKVRDVYDLGDSLLLVSTDRISAFDCILPNGIPDKGRILTALSLFWFERFGASFEHHLIATDVRSVGVQGDGRTYGHPIVLRPVSSDDAMTADWSRLPHELLQKVSSRIVSEVKGVNRVAYDVSSKPPSTIEWE